MQCLESKRIAVSSRPQFWRGVMRLGCSAVGMYVNPHTGPCLNLHTLAIHLYAIRVKYFTVDGEGWDVVGRYLSPHISTPCSHVHTPAIPPICCTCTTTCTVLYCWWGGLRCGGAVPQSSYINPMFPCPYASYSTYMLYVYDYVYSTVLFMGRVEMWWGGTSILIYQPHVHMSIHQLSTYMLYV